MLAVAAASAGPALAATLVFQQGTNGYSSAADTFLMQSVAGTAQGGGLLAEWDSDDPSGTGQDNVSLIRFDNIFGAGPGLIAPGDQITTATLTYEVVNSGNPGDVYASAVAWSESTATWNNFGGEAGVQSDERGALIGSSPGGLGTQSVSVLASIDAWKVNPALNLGWIILPVGTDGVEFRSREDATVALRPKLTVVVNEGDPPLAVPRGPYLQLATPQSVVVRWRTDLPTESVVRYGATPATLTSTASNPAVVTEHQVSVTGLLADSRYYYSIGTNAQTIAGGTVNHFFYTPPIAGTRQPTRIWAFGDFGTGDNNARAVRDAYYAYTGSIYTDIWLWLGDNAYNSGLDTEFQSAVFNTYQSMLIRTVFWSTRGNHETDSSAYYNIITHPTNAEAGGLASGSEAYYSFDYANIHFICLDSYVTSRAPGGAMMTWLTNDLAATAQDWIIAFWHHPPYSKGTHDSDTESNLIDMRSTALPILEAGGVDLVLSGHSHNYERTFLLDGHYGLSGTLSPAMILDGGSGREDGTGAYQKDLGPHNGAVYVVAGSGGALGSGSPLNHPAMYIDFQQLGSMAIDVDGNRLDAKMIRETGAVGDYFTMLKAGIGPPVVHAGPDQSIRLPVNMVNLDATVIDDGQPAPPGVVTTLWTVPSGPGSVVFGDASAVDTTATFSVVGTYVLRLTADDSAFVSYDELTVTVLPIRYIGDFDHDNDVDQADFGHLQMCLTGQSNAQGDPLCQDAKLDGDADVDIDDLMLFVPCLSGPAITPPVGCTY